MTRFLRKKAVSVFITLCLALLHKPSPANAAIENLPVSHDTWAMELSPNENLNGQGELWVGHYPFGQRNWTYLDKIKVNKGDGHFIANLGTQ